MHRRLEVEQPQHLARAVGVGVLVEDALPRTCAHGLRFGGIVEKRPIRLERWFEPGSELLVVEDADAALEAYRALLCLLYTSDAADEL